jgi:hypothetical protein
VSGAPLVLADHPLLFAVPVLVPALVVVLLVAGVVVRDRRSGRDEPDPEEWSREVREADEHG